MKSITPMDTREKQDYEQQDLTETTMLDDEDSESGLDKVYHDQQQQQDNHTHTTAGWSSSGSLSSFGGDEEDFREDDCSSKEEDYYVFHSEEEEEEAKLGNNQEHQQVLQKTLPAPSGAYKVICLSFLEPDISTSVASTVTEEALRLLQSGGLLYVVDGQGIVPKLPVLRQLLRRISTAEAPSVQLTVHEIELREIVHNHGFAAPTLGHTVTRWIGTKP